MRALLCTLFVISLACWACGPISDWPHNESDDHQGGSGLPGPGQADSGSSVVSDAGVTPRLDGGAGGAIGGAGSMDASYPSSVADAGAADPCGFDAGDAGAPDAGDPQPGDAWIDPAQADAGDHRTGFRPFPHWWPLQPVSDAQIAPVDAGQSDAESDLAHPTAAPAIPCR